MTLREFHETSRMEAGVKLLAAGSFLVHDEDWTTSNPPPHIISVKGRPWYRFMDRIYLPRPVAELQPSEVEELCRLRLALWDRLSDNRLYGTVIHAMINCVEDSEARSRDLRILDFGCGDGSSTLALQQAIPHALLAGCDMCPVALQAAAARGLPAIRIHPQTALPFSSSAFDIVFSSFVFHFGEAWKMIPELRRIASSQGKAIFNGYGQSVSNFCHASQRAGWRVTEAFTVAEYPNHWIVVLKARQ